MIQYRSTRMPIIEEIEIVSNKEEIKDEDAKIPDHEKYYERTFISILNDPKDVEYNNIFRERPLPKMPKKLRCAITKYVLLSIQFYRDIIFYFCLANLQST